MGLYPTRHFMLQKLKYMYPEIIEDGDNEKQTVR